MTVVISRWTWCYLSSHCCITFVYFVLISIVTYHFSFVPILWHVAMKQYRQGKLDLKMGHLNLIISSDHNWQLIFTIIVPQVWKEELSKDDIFFKSHQSNLVNCLQGSSWEIVTNWQTWCNWCKHSLKLCYVMIEVHLKVNCEKFCSCISKLWPCSREAWSML